MKLALKRPTKRGVLKVIKYLLIVIAGNAITASGSAFFIIPNGFAVGGTTGLGSFVRDLTGQEWLVSVTVYIANISLFLIGAALLGRKFAAATLLGTLLYPTFLSLFSYLNGLYIQANGNTIGGGGFMCVVFGGLLYGLGVALVVRVGASTGGTDIPPLILKKFFGTPVSISLWALDFSIILLQLAKNSLENVLYGVLIAIVSSIVIDRVSPIGLKKTQVEIVSKKYREIREMILNKLGRGVTILNGQTGYLKENCYVIMTIVSNRELVKIKEEVHKIDPNAFMTVSVISEVRGRGFSEESVTLPPEAEAKDQEELQGTGGKGFSEESVTLPPEAEAKDQEELQGKGGKGFSEESVTLPSKVKAKDQEELQGKGGKGFSEESVTLPPEAEAKDQEELQGIGGKGFSEESVTLSSKVKAKDQEELQGTGGKGFSEESVTLPSKAKARDQEELQGTHGEGDRA